MRYDLLGEFTTMVTPYVGRIDQPVRHRRLSSHRWLRPAPTVMLSSLLLAVF